MSAFVQLAKPRIGALSYPKIGSDISISFSSQAALKGGGD